MEWNAFLMEVFGRDNEARALVNNVRAGHNTLVIAESGLGKTGLLRWIFPLLEEEGKAIWVERSGPTFTTTLEDIYEHFEKFGWVDIDWSDYCKAYRTNDQKARGISDIFAKHEGTILVFDDCNTVTPSNRPWLEQWAESCNVIACIEPTSLQKKGAKRFWRRFDEMRLTPLSKEASAEMLDQCIKLYRINADDLVSYRRKILTLSQGSPYEIDRLVKYHSAESLVKVADINEHADRLVDREVKQMALAPLLVTALVVLAGARYAARARSDTDLLVLSGFAMIALIILLPWIRKSLKPRSSS